MNDDTRIIDLIAKLDEAHERGEPLTPHDVCATCPELLPEVERGWHQLRGAFAETRTESPPRPGQPKQLPQIPGFEILEELGHGGMGVVYKARETQLDRLVALKMVLAGHHASASDLARFQNEAKAVAALKHPNIVEIYELGEHAGLPYYTMEYCPSGSLERRVRESPLSPNEAARLVEQIADAIAFAHADSRVVAHRDLKPHNVLLTGSGSPKVSDFGLVKWRGVDQELTPSGDVMGAPQYMAPEQAAGRSDVGPAADIWALGATLYRLLAGRPPFQGATHLDTIQQVLRDEPAPLRQLNQAVPRDLETICHKCLQKDPSRRYTSARELADDLRRFQAGEPISARPVGRWEKGWKWARRNKPAAALLATVALIALAGTPIVTWLWLRAEWARQKAVAEERVKDLALRNEREARQAEAQARQAADEASGLFASFFKASDPLSFLGSDLSPPAWAKAGQRTVPEVLDELAKKLRADTRMESMVRARLLSTLGNSYRNMGRLDDARPHLQEAQQLRAANPATRAEDLIQGDFDLAMLDLESGEFEKARDGFRRVIDAQTREGFEEQQIATSKQFLGFSMSLLSDPDAEILLRDVVRSRDAAPKPDAGVRLQARVFLAAFLFDQSRPKEALALYGEMRGLIMELPEGAVRKFGEAAIECTPALAMYFIASEATGPLRQLGLQGAVAKFREALASATAAFPDPHPYIVVVQYHLAVALDKLGRDSEAEAEYRRALQMIRQTTGLAHPRVLVFTASFTSFLARIKKQAEAQQLFDEVTSESLRRYGENSSWRVALLLQRTEFESEWGEEKKAVDYARQALALIQRGKMPPTRSNCNALFDAATALNMTRQGKLVIDMHRANQPLAAKAFGPNGREVVALWREEARCQLALKQPAAANDALARAELLADSVTKPLEPIDETFLAHARGVLDEARGDVRAAEASFRRALTAARRLPADNLVRREEAAESLAGALADQGKFAEAIPLAEEAVQFAERRSASELKRAELESGAAVLRLAAGDRPGYEKSLRKLVTGTEKSTTPLVLANLAMTGGLSKSNAGWTPADVAMRLEAAIARLKNPRDRLRHALALALLRAGQQGKADEVLAKVAAPTEPIDFALRGLTAAARGNVAQAQQQLQHADDAVRRIAPSKSSPYAYISLHWSNRLQVRLLLDELRATIGNAK